MSKKQIKRVRVVAVPHEGGPDLDRIAKAIVALALKQMGESKTDEEQASPPGGAAA